MVALQMPEGLQMYACAIADIIERHVPDNNELNRRGGLLSRTLDLRMP